MATTTPSSHHYTTAFSDRRMIHMISEKTKEGKNGIEGRFVRHVEQVSPDTEFYSDIAVKRTVIEMHQVFEECRNLASIQKKLTTEEILGFSLRYRSVLQRAAVSRGTEKAKRDYVGWSLFEALFLSKADTPISIDLIRWAVTSFLHSQDALEECVQELEREQKPIDETEGYWKAAVLQLVCFRFDMCARLLSDSTMEDEATQAFTAVLRRMDTQWLLDGNEMGAYTKWQQVVRDLSEAGTFENNLNIKFLAGIVTGDMQVYNRLAAAIIPHWWQLVPFYTATFHPGTDVESMGQVVRQCRSLWTSTAEEDDERDVFSCLFELNPLASLQEMGDPCYLSAHLSDLLHKMDSSLMDSSIELRNYLLADYGNVLMAHSDLWEIGAFYLCEVGAEGRGFVELHLCAMHIDGENTANKVWRIVKKEALDEAARMLVNTMTNRYVRSGAWGSAIGWALRGDKNCRALDTVCNAILFKASCDQITRLSILEQVGDLILQSPGLVFLYSYYQFNKLLVKGNLLDAVRKLVSIFQSSTVPPRFHNKLFEHLLEILGSGDEIILEKQMIYDLMSFLRQYRINRKYEKENESDTQLVTVTTLLSKALARSIVVFK